MNKLLCGNCGRFSKSKATKCCHEPLKLWGLIERGICLNYRWSMAGSAEGIKRLTNSFLLESDPAKKQAHLNGLVTLHYLNLEFMNVVPPNTSTEEKRAIYKRTYKQRWCALNRINQL